MKLNVEIKPLTVNRAWRGRRFKSSLYSQYERDLGFLLPTAPEILEGELSVRYIFHIKNYGLSDAGNFEKCLTDILVKNGYIKDDRYIKEIACRKERLLPGEDEYIEIEIKPA